LLKCNRKVTTKNYRKAPRWRNNDDPLVSVSGNAQIFRTTAPKPEAQGGPVTVQLIIQKYSGNEVGEFIENPVVVDDTDDE
jgi:hypothetical protein